MNEPQEKLPFGFLVILFNSMYFAASVTFVFVELLFLFVITGKLVPTDFFAPIPPIALIITFIASIVVMITDALYLKNSNPSPTKKGLTITLLSITGVGSVLLLFTFVIELVTQ